MNKIEATLIRFNQLISPEQIEIATKLGLPFSLNTTFTSDDRVFIRQQLSQTAEFTNYQHLVILLSNLAKQPQSSWAQHFEVIAKFQWELTVDTELSYKYMPESLGYRLLNSVAAIIYQNLTPEARLHKILNGNEQYPEIDDPNEDATTLDRLTEELANHLQFQPRTEAQYNSLRQLYSPLPVEMESDIETIAADDPTELRLKYLPLSLFDNVIENMRKYPWVGAGRIISVILDMISAEESSLLIQQLCGELDGENILNLIHYVGSEKLAAILQEIDSWGEHNPFRELKYFAKMLNRLNFIELDLKNVMQHSLSTMQFTVMELVTALKHTREPTAEQLIRLQLEPITRTVLAVLQDDNNTVDQQTLLDHTNEWLISALKNQSSAHQASKIQKAYQFASLSSG